MPSTIFFSWQIDTPGREGRNFIERALERAVSRISKDESVEEAERELAVDRDTKGVAGSPPIVDTIFRKIDQAAVFVPDLTFIGNRPDGRPTPNPNVLIECGWALKSITHGRIVPVMNTAFGQPSAENMPFDMHHLRNPITYHCPEDFNERQHEMTVDEAIAILLELLQSGRAGEYGYDLYPRQGARAVVERMRLPPFQDEPLMRELAPISVEALGGDLNIRGIMGLDVKPGTSIDEAQDIARWLQDHIVSMSLA